MASAFTQNFIPELWHEAIFRNLENAQRFAADCTREFEGEVRKYGDTVHILGLEPITVRDIDLAGKTDAQRKTALENIQIEGIGGVDDTLTIDKIAYFGFKVQDVDKKQALTGLMQTASKDAAYQMADTVDKKISAVAAAGTANVVDKTSTAVSEQNVLKFFDEAVEKLQTNNVPTEMEIVAVISPRALKYFRWAHIDLDTNNSDYLKNGTLGRYNGVTLKLSNNVTKAQTTAAGDTDVISLRTKRAIALVEQLKGTETLRDPNSFADIVRGQLLYGTKIIRPAELVNLKLKYA